MSEQPACLRCGKPVPPQPHPGRKKIFCSPNCRSAYHKAKAPVAVTAPRPATRKPLPPFAVKAAWELRSDVERMERIFADERFPRHVLQVATQVRGHLEYAAQVCQDLLGRLSQLQEGNGHEPGNSNYLHRSGTGG